MPATNRKAKARRRQNMEFIVPPTERFLTRHLSEEQKMFSIWIENFGANQTPPIGSEEYPLRMVRRSAQVGIQKAPALGIGTAVGWFQSHKYGVDVLQDTRVVYLENPTIERRIIHVEEPEICRLAAACFAVSPGLESGCGAVVALILKIESVKNQEFLLDVVHAAESTARFSVALHVINIHNVQIARAKESLRFSIFDRRRWWHACRLLSPLDFAPEVSHELLLFLQPLSRVLQLYLESACQLVFISLRGLCDVQVVSKLLGTRMGRSNLRLQGFLLDG